MIRAHRDVSCKVAGHVNKTGTLWPCMRQGNLKRQACRATQKIIFDNLEFRKHHRIALGRTPGLTRSFHNDAQARNTTTEALHGPHLPMSLRRPLVYALMSNGRTAASSSASPCHLLGSSRAVSDRATELSIALPWPMANLVVKLPVRRLGFVDAIPPSRYSEKE